MKKILVLIAFLMPSISMASLEIGTGYSSSHSGRMVPTLAVGLSSQSFVLSGYAAGVSNKYYYHNAYGLHAMSLGKVGRLLGGDVVAGGGLGLMYAKRAFKDLDSSEAGKDDFAIGPAFRVNWTIFNFMYINIDATYGIRNFGSHLFLNFQDVISTSLGIRLW